jgi:AraC-like DNA-binding protein
MSYVEPPLIDHDHLHLRVFTAKNVTLHNNWNVDNICSSYWRLYQNTADGAWVELGDRSYPLEAERIYLIPAWVRFSCRGSTRKLDHLYAHFDVIGLPGVVIRSCFQAPVLLPVDALAVRECRWLRGMLEHTAYDQPIVLCRIKALLYRSFAEALANLDRIATKRLSAYTRSGHAVTPAIRHIDEHYGESVSNGDLAKLCQLSESHFIRQFRDHVGQTPAQYVLERRVAAAAERLVFGADAIDDIAEQCGFPDRFYFTRMFTRLMGVPPSAYRRTVRV